jgi:NodT family efflux transporter outer membrane factor (OMF) lipoprotein
MLRRAVEAAQADDDAVRAASDVTRITVVADVVRAYVQSCSAAEELGIAQRSVDIQKQRTAITRRLADVGRSNTTDVTRDEAEIQSLEAEVPRFVADRRIAQYKLAALLSIAPGALPPKVLSCERTPAIDQPIPVGDGAALLKRRPDVRQAERKLAAATARIGVAVGALYPSISIGASAGLTGASKDLGSPQTQRYGYGPLISWTFPVNGERERVKEARAESDAQLARFDGVVLDALRETETSLAANAADVQRISALHGSLEMASRSADQTHSLYEAGRDSFISDLDATRTLNVSRAKLAAAQAQLALDQVTLFLALGGGWEGADKTAQNASVANNQSGRRD